MSDLIPVKRDFTALDTDQLISIHKGLGRSASDFRDDLVAELFKRFRDTYKVPASAIAAYHERRKRKRQRDLPL